MSALQRLVDDRLRELGRSAREAARIAEAAGVPVSHATVAHIASGTHHGKVSDRVIEALAAGLEIPATRLAEAAGRSGYQPPTEFVIPDKYKRLRPEMRQVVFDQLDALLALQERLDSEDD